MAVGMRLLVAGPNPTLSLSSFSSLLYFLSSSSLTVPPPRLSPSTTTHAAPHRSSTTLRTPNSLNLNALPKTFSLPSLSFARPSQQHSLSLSFSPNSSAATVSRSHHSFPISTGRPFNLRFCGLRREAFGLDFTTSLNCHLRQLPRCQHSAAVSATLFDNGNTSESFDYDLLIIGADVGGQGAALHAVEKNMLPLVGNTTPDFEAEAVFYQENIQVKHKRRHIAGQHNISFSPPVRRMRTFYFSLTLSCSAH